MYFSDNLNHPWLVIGDFNEVTCQNEKFGGRRINYRKVNMYVNAMNYCKLIDLGYNGSKFTWTNKRRNNPILERLDRGWSNGAWCSKFPNASLWHLPRVTSDHCPLLLKLDNPTPRHGPKPFRFEPMWFRDPSFDQTVDRVWERENTNAQG